MPARRASPRVRFSISCLDSQWERIREAAQRRGVWINEHVISAGLTVALGPEPPDAPVLALSEAEQRRLLDRVDRLAESMLAAAGPHGGSIALLRQSVGLLVMTTLRDMVRQGRENELGPLLEDVFGAGAAPELEQKFRQWMEREPPPPG